MGNVRGQEGKGVKGQAAQVRNRETMIRNRCYTLPRFHAYTLKKVKLRRGEVYQASRLMGPQATPPGKMPGFLSPPPGKMPGFLSPPPGKMPGFLSAHVEYDTERRSIRYRSCCTSRMPIRRHTNPASLWPRDFIFFCPHRDRGAQRPREYLSHREKRREKEIR